MKKRGFILFFLMLNILFFTSCTNKVGVGKDQSTKDSKKLNIGYDIYSPYTYVDEKGNMAGIDIEIAKEACKRIGYQPVFQRITWGEHKKLLKNKSIDCIWCSFSENGRQKQYQWTTPYLKSHEVVVVRADSKIKKLSDLEGKKVAVQVDTKAEEYFLKQMKKGKLHLEQLSTYKNMIEAMAAFNKGYVDAIASHEAVLKAYTKNNSKNYFFIETPIVYSNLGVAFRKDYNTEIIELLSSTLQEMTKDGTIEAIVKKYGIDASHLMEVQSSDWKESK